MGLSKKGKTIVGERKIRGIKQVLKGSCLLITNIFLYVPSSPQFLFGLCRIVQKDNSAFESYICAPSPRKITEY